MNPVFALTYLYQMCAYYFMKILHKKLRKITVITYILNFYPEISPGNIELEL